LIQKIRRLSLVLNLKLSGNLPNLKRVLSLRKTFRLLENEKRIVKEKSGKEI